MLGWACDTVGLGICLVNLVRRVRQKKKSIPRMRTPPTDAPTAIPAIAPLESAPLLSVPFPAEEGWKEEPEELGFPSIGRLVRIPFHESVQKLLGALVVMVSVLFEITTMEEANPRGPGAWASHHFEVTQFIPRKAACRNTRPRWYSAPLFWNGRQGKYCVGRSTIGWVKVRLNRANGTRISMGDAPAGLLNTNFI